MVVMIDEPEGDVYYGGDVAAPVFSAVAEQALRLLNVKPDKAPQLVSRKQIGEVTHG
jgi:cell division protein FtsI (penicillin-binding protein 3)